jgi:hypothetical protein
MNNKPKYIENASFPQIALELEEMVSVDQEMRKKNLADDEFWDKEIDRKNTERMKLIIKEIGWPTRTKVGERGMKDAWLLVQHADHDLEFQRQCLELMLAEDPDEVGRRNIAYLTDRVLVNEGKPQLYGSQFTGTSGAFIPKPVEDMEHINDRRKEMGLSNIEEGIAEMNEKYKS